MAAARLIFEIARGLASPPGGAVLDLWGEYGVDPSHRLRTVLEQVQAEGHRRVPKALLVEIEIGFPLVAILGCALDLHNAKAQQLLAATHVAEDIATPRQRFPRLALVDHGLQPRVGVPRVELRRPPIDRVPHPFRDFWHRQHALDHRHRNVHEVLSDSPATLSHPYY